MFTNRSYQNQVKLKIVKGIIELFENVHSLLVVSNEVLYDQLDSGNKVVWVYQKLLGEIHQELVTFANEAYLIELGLPIRKK